MSFSQRVFKVVKESDLILEILDARFAEDMRNNQLERLIELENKKLILVLNKSDLLSKTKTMELKEKLERSNKKVIFVSSKTRNGLKLLREVIYAESNHQKIKVGLIGYPNTGKSSLINMLRGKHVAETSSKAGFTKGERWVKINDNVLLLDSPGTIPLGERDEVELILWNAKNIEDLKEVETVCLQALEKIKIVQPDWLKKNFGLNFGEKSLEELLEELALKNHKLRKGGVPDSENMARLILKKWQKG